MTRKDYNKLIRDRIPEIIEGNGDKPHVSILSENAFKKALKDKMMEEAKELAEADSRDDILNELSDVEELVRSVARENGISAGELEEKRMSKSEKRGGFEKRLFLEWVDED